MTTLDLKAIMDLVEIPVEETLNKEEITYRLPELVIHYNPYEEYSPYNQINLTGRIPLAVINEYYKPNPNLPSVLKGISPLEKNDFNPTCDKMERYMKNSIQSGIIAVEDPELSVLQHQFLNNNYYDMYLKEHKLNCSKEQFIYFLSLLADYYHTYKKGTFYDHFLVGMSADRVVDLIATCNQKQLMESNIYQPTTEWLKENAPHTLLQYNALTTTEDKEIRHLLEEFDAASAPYSTLMGSNIKPAIEYSNRLSISFSEYIYAQGINQMLITDSMTMNNIIFSFGNQLLGFKITYYMDNKVISLGHFLPTDGNVELLKIKIYEIDSTLKDYNSSYGVQCLEYNLTEDRMEGKYVNGERIVKPNVNDKPTIISQLKQAIEMAKSITGNMFNPQIDNIRRMNPNGQPEAKESN